MCGGVGCNGLRGVRHNTFSAYEIERRPRGASRDKPAPTSVSGQLLLRQIGCSLGAWLKIDEEQSRPLDIEWNKQGGHRCPHRSDWPETDVERA